MILQAPAMDADEALEALFAFNNNDLPSLSSSGEEDLDVLTNGVSTDEENGDFCSREDKHWDGETKGTMLTST